jgi:hypothetical protein
MIEFIGWFMYFMALFAVCFIAAYALLNRRR